MRSTTLFFLICSFLVLPAHAQAQPDFDTVLIAPLEEALSLARVSYNGTDRLIAVMAYDKGLVTGKVLLSLPDDPITAFQEIGYDGLKNAIYGSETDLTVSASDLLIPVELGDLHIAAGTNFPEHGEEATVEDGPFLFPKAVQPTGPLAPVSAGSGLLDYEVELCFIAFEAIDLEASPTRFGLVLCNDYTDRAELLRHIDPFDVTSGQGFTTGKSAPGFLPIGNLFVIPDTPADFVPDVELRLYRNGVLQQHAFQRQAIWNFEQLVQQTKIRQDVSWAHKGADIALPLENNKIPLRVALLGGTPSGTIFQGDISYATQAKGVFAWLMGGWDNSIAYWVIESVIEELRAQGQFLRPGEDIIIHVDHLGVISNRLVE